MKFWDSSALVLLCVDEPQTQQLRQVLEADRGVTVWWGTPVECASALARRWREGTLDRRAYEKAGECLESMGADWIVVAASEEVRRLAWRSVRVHQLRAGDELQLAAAMLWADGRPRGREFASLDSHLADAARLEGFTVVPDGARDQGAGGRERG